jgi:hypothetical protein
MMIHGFMRGYDDEHDDGEITNDNGDRNDDDDDNDDDDADDACLMSAW